MKTKSLESGISHTFRGTAVTDLIREKRDICEKIERKLNNLSF